jgi:pilus assembly protein CpaC
MSKQAMNALTTFIAGCTTAVACVASAIAAPPTITLEPGQQKTWSHSKLIKRAATGDSDVVGINVVPPSGIIITAKKYGTAMVSIWEQGRDTPSSQFQVVVRPSPINAKQVLGTDAAGAQIEPQGTKLRLSGALSSLERHNAVVSALVQEGKPSGLAALFGLGGKDNKDSVVDMSTSGFDTQVRIDIKIVEVSRSKLKEAGFYYQRHDFRPDGSYAGSTGFSNPNNYAGFTNDPQTGYKFLSASGTVPFTDAFNIFSVSNNVWAAFSALEANGFAYALAEPSLTAMSGQPATFLVGGEIPIPYRSGTDGAISVDYKKFGISVSLTPTVLDQNRIAIRIAPEISEIDPSLTVTSGGYSIPGLKVRRTDTTVALGDGETFVLSGLVSRQSSAAIDKFPFLGDIPILGAFFRSNRFTKEDKELLMVATPHLVRPFAKGAKLPGLPGDDIHGYDPSFMHLFLKETGRFEPPDSGFSN